MATAPRSKTLDLQAKSRASAVRRMPRPAPDTVPAVEARAWRLYHVDAPTLGPLDHWDTELDRIARLGFDHVVLGRLFDGQPSSDGGYATGDPLRFNPALADGPLREALQQVLAQGRALGLGAWIDLDLRFAVPHSATERALEPWLAAPASREVIDPRASSIDAALRPLRWADGAGSLLAYWTDVLRAHAHMGLSGFRCLGADALPPAAWQQLIAAARADHPGLRFLCWTPGMPAAAVEALASAGFDGAVLSLPWWNGRDGWLVEEHARLSPFGAVLTMPQPPATEAGELRFERDAAGQRRALWSAAQLADGWLVPMGVEFGLRDGFRLAGPEAADEWQRLRREPRIDLADEVVAANRVVAERAAYRGAELRALSSPGGPVALLTRRSRTGASPLVVAINGSTLRPASIGVDAIVAHMPGAVGGLIELADVATADAVRSRWTPLERIALQPGQVRAFQPAIVAPVAVAASTRSVERARVEAAIAEPRIALENLQPSLNAGRFAVRRIVGERVEVSVDAWIDGHDVLAGAIRHRAVGDAQWREEPLVPDRNDRWRGSFALDRLGRHEFTVVVWRDSWASWLDEVAKKHAAGRPLELEIVEGLHLVESRLSAGAADAAASACLASLQALKDAPLEQRLAALLADATRAVMRANNPRDFAATWPQALPVEAERLESRYSSWYELFPRSIEGKPGDPVRHGTFDDVIARIPQIAAMGFDVLYFPPIHPIGVSHRKGPNNSLTAGPDDPGVPYAIGAEAGGHDAIHPELGTFDDFHRMRDVAKSHGLELALDFAVQCSPDHPWIRSNPEWFAFRPDGTLKYAENPPKKYEDIINVDFYTERRGRDRRPGAPALWLALRNAVLFWIAQGVMIFRVDNPHTKPLPFWEWLIADVRARHPQAIFLAEAFTRPKMMARLGKIGFSQSYTYFTWRNTKAEIIEYLTELSTPPLSQFYRPHFFVNTPDINPVFLQRSGRAGHLIRAALATTLSGLWGMYNGFELCEATPIPGKEEYLDSEKYQIRIWDWNRPGNIKAEITRLNELRRRHPALQTHLGVTFYGTPNDQVLWYSKGERDRNGHFVDDAVLVAVSVDPFGVQSCPVELPLWEFGLDDHAALDAEDLMTGERFSWAGKWQYLHIDPNHRPFGLWRVRPFQPD